MSDNTTELLKELAEIYKQLNVVPERFLTEEAAKRSFLPVYRETQALNARADIIWNEIHDSGLTVKEINSAIEALLS
jgi:hypothetical protein